MTTLLIRSQFVAFHRWKDAPDDVKFLRDYHRHVFHVQVVMPVSHNNRDLEFFQFKRKLDSYLRTNFENVQFDWSCEQFAEDLCVYFRAEAVTVSEDGENGAMVRRSAAATGPKSGPFTGLELEGPHKGARVLFLPGKTSGADIKRITDQVTADLWVMSAERIYVGAGNDLNYSTELLGAALHLAQLWKIQVDVEVSSLGFAANAFADAQALRRLKQLGWVIVRDAKRMWGTIDHDMLRRLKSRMVDKTFDQETVCWEMPDGKLYPTWIYHPSYDNDQYVLPYS